MNRIIKFRAWDKEEKKMIDVDSFYFSDQFEPFVDSVKSAQKRFEIMQFTGLYDKNGKEIFEGDIVIDRETKCKILWLNEGAQFISQALDDSGWDMMDDVYETYEVVGNIWEQKTTAE